MQKDPSLIGLEAMTRGAIRLQVAFVSVDVVFHLSASTVTVSVKPLGAGLLHVGYDKARVDAIFLLRSGHRRTPSRAFPVHSWGGELISYSLVISWTPRFAD